MLWSKKNGAEKVLVSHTGHQLTRRTAFKFALDPNQAQTELLFQYAGASRLWFNHHLGRVKANLSQREAEASYGVKRADLTPALSWSKQSFINEMNAWKNGQAPDSPVDPDISEVGLPWRDTVSADVFETARVDAAQALKNWRDAKTGARKVRRFGFPKFKAKHKTTPKFRLRSRSKPG